MLPGLIEGLLQWFLWNPFGARPIRCVWLQRRALRMNHAAPRGD
jgi:hypothetical protein